MKIFGWRFGQVSQFGYPDPVYQDVCSTPVHIQRTYLSGPPALLNHAMFRDQPGPYFPPVVKYPAMTASMLPVRDRGRGYNGGDRNIAANWNNDPLSYSGYGIPVDRTGGLI